MSIAKEPTKLWGFEFIFLLIASFINFGSFGMAIPIFPGYAVSLGASLSVAGVVTGMFSVVALVGRPVSGLMGDRLNKKHLLIISAVLNGLITILYVFVPSIAWVIPVRFLQGLAFSVNGTIAFALGAEFIPKARMGEGVGFLGVGQIVGMAIGPNLGIFLVYHFSYQFNFAVSGGIMMLSGLMVLFLKYNPVADENKVKRSFKLKDLVAVELLPNALFAGTFMLGNGLTTSFLVLMGVERGIEGVGIFFVVNAIVVLLTRPLAGRLIDKKGVAFVVIPGFLITAVSMLFIGFALHVAFIAGAAVLFALGAGTSMPAIQADCLMRLGKQRSAVATGTYLIGLDIGMTIGPVVGGIMADGLGFRTTFVSAAGLMFIGFCMYLLYKKISRVK
ncbi:MAG: MFS transporter [Defluviitaleaceae bacterium]|nr:MFS transporter [Defluviitaleaceae bacterium]